MFTTIFKTLYAHSTELSFTDLRCNYDDIYEVYTDSSEITMVSVTVSDHDVLIKFSNELTYDVNVAIFVNALDGQFIPVTSYNQLTDLPILFDGDYENLTNKPDIPQVAEDLQCVNPSTLEDDTTQNVLNMVFQSVSDGKELIADAITDKGIPTSASDTFSTMATNIGQISGGGSSDLTNLTELASKTSPANNAENVYTFTLDEIGDNDSILFLSFIDTGNGNGSGARNQFINIENADYILLKNSPTNGSGYCSMGIIYNITDDVNLSILHNMANVYVANTVKIFGLNEVI